MKTGNKQARGQIGNKKTGILLSPFFDYHVFFHWSLFFFMGTHSFIF